MTSKHPLGYARFCAVCAEDIVGEPIREPIGRDDAMVSVCADCASKSATGADRRRQPSGFGPRMVGRRWGR